MTTTAPPPSRVTKWPTLPKKPPIIIAAPAPTSPSATKLATISGAAIPMLSNQGTIFSGGNGNLPKP